MIGLKSVQAKFVGLMLGGMAALWGGGAEAQSIVQPPVVSAIDSNGVNLADGSYQTPGLDVATGGSGSGIANVTQGASNNFSGVITSEQLPVQFNGNTATEVVFYTNVSYGGTTYRFLVGHYQASVGGNPWFTAPYYSMSGNATLTCTGQPSDVQSHVGTCTLILPDGTTALYDKTLTSGTAYGPVTSITKPDGEVITPTYTMSGSNVTGLLSVNSTLGWMLKYESGKVTAINSSVTYCSPTASTCSVPSSDPTVSISTSGATTTWSRNGVTYLTATVSGNTATYTTPLGAAKTVTTSGGKVSSVTMGGSTWTYSYSTDGSGNTTTTVTEPITSLTHSLTVSYDHKVLAKTDDAGRKTSYIYDSTGRLAQVVDPDGSNITGGFTGTSYDSTGRVTATYVVPKGGATNGAINPGAAIMTTTQYGATCDFSGLTNIKYCNKPTSTTDANGITATFTYDANSGNVATVTLPAVNGVQAQTRYTYTAQTPHSYNASGSFVAQPVVYRLTTTSRCKSSNWTGSACGNGTTDERKTTVTYNNTNVLPYSTTTSVGDGSLPQTTTVAQYSDNGDVMVSQGLKQNASDETYFFYDVLRRQIGSVGVDPDSAGPRHRQATATYYNADGRIAEVDTGIVGAGTSSAYSGGDPATRNSQAYSDWQAMTSTSSLVQERRVTEFDIYGRPLIAAHYIGNAPTAKDVTQRSYDSMQRVSCDAVRLNSADYANDFAGLKSSSACALGTTGADGSHDRITVYGYDTLSDLISTTGAYGTASARTNVLKSYDIGSPTSTGTLTYAEDGNGNRTSYFYDSFNRLVKTCYPLPSTTHASSTSDCERTEPPRVCRRLRL